MEDPDEPENSTNRAEKESEMKMEEEEEQIGGNGSETNEEEEEDDDDDDFGDFEEAPSKIESGEGTSAAENNPRRETQARISAPSLPPIFSMTIRRLLDEPTIWQCTSAEAEMNFSTQTRPPPFDLFPRLDAGSAANEEIPQIPDEFMLKAHLLWTQLCYLEEAMALKFKWDAQSLTYQRLVWAIDLQQKSKNRKQPIERRKQQRRKDEEKPNQDQETAPNVATVVGEEKPSTSKGLNQSDQSNIKNDSLVVPLPPTDFDSNFFLENQSTAITNGIDPMNSASILAGDLASFGIASTAIECEEKNNGTNHVNSLSLLDAGKLAKMGIDGQKKLAAMSQLDEGNPQFG